MSAASRQRQRLLIQRKSGRLRRGFTLVELLVSITIIGILAGLVFGALQRAGGVSKVVHTKSTIAKLNASLMDRWDSYRNRRLPINPRAVFSSSTTQGNNARSFALSLWQNRGSNPNDALNKPLVNSIPANPSNLQIAATRLLAIRELMKFEMPNGMADFADFNQAPTPGVGWPPAKLVVLQSPPPVALSYLAALNNAYVSGATPAQLKKYESAECLYMMLTIGSTDGGLFGEQLPTADVGDADGDGLPEFQDAWPVTDASFAPKGNSNNPIYFIRWAPGFMSDSQPDPSIPTTFEFSASNHDFFDPLKLDVPGVNNQSPRGFQLYPLIFSAGPDGQLEVRSSTNDVDPYTWYTTPPPGPAGQDGAWFDTNNDNRDQSVDNITNQNFDTRTGR